MIRPKQLARLGEFHLEEAILDVLLEARHEELCLGAAEISRQAGIYRERPSQHYQRRHCPGDAQQTL